MATEPVSTVSTTDTATPQEPDWTLAQLLYTKGDPLDKVCRQANVTLSALKKRAHRKGWTAAKQAVHIHTQTITRHAAKEVANSVRPKLHGHLNAITDDPLLKGPSKSLSHLKRKLDVIYMGAQAGKVLEGWNDQTDTQIVSIEEIRQLSPDVVTPLLPSEPQGPCLDVQSTAVPPVPLVPPAPAE